MQMVRIKFKNDKDDALGSYELAKRMKVICLPNDVYEVSAKGLNILNDLNIDCQIIKREGLDYVRRAIRDTLTSPV